ncbi:MAG TPA: alkaline phosphatase family protein, partial [Acidobacteriaceae bacterium]|nr:alkaline phosphatase family protein [Acidobacteriaceae bacterium]
MPKFATALRAFAAIVCLAALSRAAGPPPARRMVIVKIDGLNGSLLGRYMHQIDPATGKPELPWFAHIFLDHGTVFQNFYTRGISLSAPSWSILDTGRHAIVRGNVEYDRYTGRIYDYLNFVPYYLNYARKHRTAMPGVLVLDRAGIPLMSDQFGFQQRFQSFQLFQRGVHWGTVAHALKRRFSSRTILSSIEGAGSPPVGEALLRSTEIRLERDLQNPHILYLDFFTGEIDHTGHETNDPAALLAALKHLDATVGRIWMTIQNSPLADQTVFAAVSDHGMNTVPGVISQTFSLIDLFNSPAGGAHHVLTDRYQMSNFKLKGLNPMVHRVVTPSTASFYLAGKASEYPTAWLDIDGNERASVQFRNSDVNKIQILLQQLAKPDLPPRVRAAAAACLRQTIDRHRAAWTRTAGSLDTEMAALEHAMEAREQELKLQPKKWTRKQRRSGKRRAAFEQKDELRS